MNRQKRIQIGLSVLALCFFLLGAEAIVDAKTLHVVNTGVDSATCGDKSTPSRSLTQAIVNAAVGAKTLVCSGIYGDLNHNGIYESDEEAFPAALTFTCADA
jgi:hypothetical protein